MKNNFSIKNSYDRFEITIAWENEIGEKDKEKVNKLIALTLELWNGKEKMLSEIERISQERWGGDLALKMGSQSK